MTDRTETILAHQPLVRSIARRHWLKRRWYEDLEAYVSAGNVGLINAVDRYNPDRGTSFKTYASFRINGAILDWLRESSELSRRMMKSGFSIIREDASVAGIAEKHGGFDAVDSDDEVRGILCLILKPRNQRILRMWCHGEPMSAIGHDVGLTAGRISQLISRSLRALRKQIHERN